MEAISQSFIRREVPVFLKRSFEVCMEIEKLVSDELIFRPSQSEGQTNTAAPNMSSLGVQVVCKGCEVVSVIGENNDKLDSQSGCTYPVLQLSQIRNFVQNLVEVLRSMRSAIMANEMQLPDVCASLRSFLSDINDSLLGLDDASLPAIVVPMASGNRLRLKFTGCKFTLGESKKAVVCVCEHLVQLKPTLDKLNEILRRLYDKASVLVECAEDIGL